MKKLHCRRDNKCNGEGNDNIAGSRHFKDILQAYATITLIGYPNILRVELHVVFLVILPTQSTNSFTFTKLSKQHMYLLHNHIQFPSSHITNLINFSLPMLSLPSTTLQMT
jgi:hypothetical protein